MTEPREPECGSCGATGTGLFFTPGGWGWSDDPQDGRTGLCEACGTGNPRFTEMFRERFGNVSHVSDGDSAGSREAVGKRSPDSIDSGQPQG